MKDPQPNNSGSTPDDSVAPRGDQTQFAPMRLLPWGIAACLVAAAAFLGLRTVSLHSENAALRTERELAKVAAKIAQNQLSERTILAEKMISNLGTKLQRTENLGRLEITPLTSLLGNLPETKAVAVWDAEQQSGLLTVEKLPMVAAEQDYQLWIIDPQYAAPVAAGVFKPDSTGRASLTFKARQPIQRATGFAISLEKNGGAPAPEGPRVLLGKH